MKERPILFSGPMVRALIEGRKTQTRRIVKPQPPFGCSYVINGAQNAALCRSVERPEVWVVPTPRSVDHRLPCVYGQPGDRLWVKETFSAHGAFGDYGRKVYRADIPDGKEPHGLHWKPSIFMPRAASRMALEVVGVRVERLQDISENDANAEGVRPLTCEVVFCVPTGIAVGTARLDVGVDGRLPCPGERFVYSGETFYIGAVKPFYVGAYLNLWEEINGRGSWAANPWVWVVEFRHRDPQ
jgi:hypothetical protein